MALGRRLALVLVAAGALACHESSPTAPEAGAVLVLTYTGPCASGSVLVTLDGTAVGRVRIPGALSLPLGPGTHTLQAGGSPAVSFEMPAGQDLILTNVPSVCP